MPMPLVVVAGRRTSSGVTATCSSVQRDDRRRRGRRQPPRQAAERDREIEQRRFALIERAARRLPARRPVAPFLLRQRQVEAEPLRVVGHGAGRLLQRLAEHGQELAAPGDACRWRGRRRPTGPSRRTGRSSSARRRSNASSCAIDASPAARSAVYGPVSRPFVDERAARALADAATAAARGRRGSRRTEIGRRRRPANATVPLPRPSMRRAAQRRAARSSASNPSASASTRAVSTCKSRRRERSSASVPLTS